MKKLFITTFVSCVFFLAATAFAGYHNAISVYVSQGSYASGSVQAASTSTDSLQLIGCNSWSYGGGIGATCFATDANGTYTSCYTYDSYLASVAQSVTSNSYISFNISNHVCTYIGVDNGSVY